MLFPTFYFILFLQLREGLYIFMQQYSHIQPTNFPFNSFLSALRIQFPTISINWTISNSTNSNLTDTPTKRIWTTSKTLTLTFDIFAVLLKWFLAIWISWGMNLTKICTNFKSNQTLTLSNQENALFTPLKLLTLTKTKIAIFQALDQKAKQCLTNSKNIKTIVFSKCAKVFYIFKHFNREVPKMQLKIFSFIYDWLYKIVLIATYAKYLYELYYFPSQNLRIHLSISNRNSKYVIDHVIFSVLRLPFQTILMNWTTSNLINSTKILNISKISTLSLRPILLQFTTNTKNQRYSFFKSWILIFFSSFFEMKD